MCVVSAHNPVLFNTVERSGGVSLGGGQVKAPVCGWRKRGMAIGGGCGKGACQWVG